MTPVLFLPILYYFVFCLVLRCELKSDECTILFFADIQATLIRSSVNGILMMHSVLQKTEVSSDINKKHSKLFQSDPPG